MELTLNSFAAEKAVRDISCDCLVCKGKAGLSTFAADGSYLAHIATGTIKTATTIEVNPDNFSASGVLVNDDSFAFLQLDVVKGETYLINMRGSGPNPLSDTLIFLFDQTLDFDHPVAIDDDGGQGLNSMITFTADYTGPYYAFVGGVPGDSRIITGGFTVDTRKMGADETPFSLAGAKSIIAGTTTFGFIQNSLTDGDVYKVILTKGLYYSIEVDGGSDYASDYLDLPQGELDTRVLLLNSRGQVVASNDDASFGSGDIGSGIPFIPEESGVYYIAVQAYENLTTGAGQVGGYSVTVSPGIDVSTLDPLEALRWDAADNVDFVTVSGVRTAYVFFGDSNVNFGQLGDDGNPMITIDWNSYEKGQVMEALEEYEKILGVNYEITTDVNQATFRLLKTTSDFYGAYFFPQEPAFGPDQGVGVFNVDSGGWSFDKQQSLEQGGYSFGVILHEFGHAHGLAHPHDNGGGSEIIVGGYGFDALGLYDLNQGVYTVMSYNDGWERHPDGPSPYNGANIDNGWSGTLGAFDIAALQERYGANPFATGNTVYELQDDNQKAFYSTIWDTGGNDSIIYGGKADAVIDLTAATLDYSPTGGGVLSFVDTAGGGIWGGYTIANGVVIENARGGDGNDVLIGNAAANRLEGNNGDDVLLGRDGNDILEGKNGSDRLDGGAGNDRLTGENHSDELFGGAGNDTLDGGNEADFLNGGAGNDRLIGGNGKDVFAFTDAGNDTIADYQKGEIIDFGELLGATRPNVTLAANGKSIFVNLDADFATKELTINIQGSSVNASDIIYGLPAMTAASADYMIAA